MRTTIHDAVWDPVHRVRRVCTFERVLAVVGQTGSTPVEWVRFEHIERDATHMVVRGARLIYLDNEPWKLIYREGVPFDNIEE